jgi:hypothetical protein
MHGLPPFAAAGARLEGAVTLSSQRAPCGPEKLERDLFCMRIALYRVTVAANHHQMFAMLHHGTLCMMRAAGVHPDRMAARRPGQKRYRAKLYG